MNFTPLSKQFEAFKQFYLDKDIFQKNIFTF